MIHNIALTLIFGAPAIMYGGILTFLLILFTATVGYLNFKGIQTIPFKWHPRLAIATLIIATMHAFFGLAVLLKF